MQKPAVKLQKRNLAGVIVAILLAVGSVLMLPTTLILVIGLIPSGVAFFADPSKEKTLGPTVLFLNFAGIIPLLFKLWQQGHTVDNALDILTQPFMLLTALLPAAFGWFLFIYVPVLVAGIIRRNAETRIRRLEREQAFLIDTWGDVLAENVIQTKPETAQEKSSTLA